MGRSAYPEQAPTGASAPRSGGWGCTTKRPGALHRLDGDLNTPSPTASAMISMSVTTSWHRFTILSISRRSPDVRLMA